MRASLHSSLFVIAAAAMSCAAFAQNSAADKATFMVMPAAAGGTTEPAARMLTEPLGKPMGQYVVVDNRAGGNGAIAAVAVKRAVRDGNTLLMQYSGFHVITHHLVQNAQWELKDFVAVGNVLSAPEVVMVRERHPVKTMADLIAYAKANPDKLTYASSGNGSFQHVTGEMLAQQAGTLKSLAITHKTRIVSLPNVSTAAEAGRPNLDASSWFGVYVPAKTPPATVDKLAADIARVIDTPAFQQRATEPGAGADYMNRQRFLDFTATELVRWREGCESSKDRS